MTRETGLEYARSSNGSAPHSDDAAAQATSEQGFKPARLVVPLLLIITAVIALRRMQAQRQAATGA